MKKIVLLSAMALTIGLSACQKDGYTERTQTLSGSAINIISDLENETVYVSNGYYTFNLKITNDAMTATVASSELIADNRSLAFTSAEQTYKSLGTNVFMQNISATAGSTGMMINDDVFEALFYYDKTYNPYGYYYNTADAGEYTYSLNTYAPYITVAKYMIGDTYKVNTFPTNSFFQGTTTTSYPSAEGMTSNETDAITYRVIMDIEHKTATMIIYNAKFSGSPAEPTKAAIIAKDLKVEFGVRDITITGENIVPLVVEGNSTTPNENYVFNNITFKTTNTLYTTASIDYTVATVFKGSFSGSYINSYYLSPQN